MLKVDPGRAGRRRGRQRRVLYSLCKNGRRKHGYGWYSEKKTHAIQPQSGGVSLVTQDTYVLNSFPHQDALGLKPSLRLDLIFGCNPIEAGCIGDVPSWSQFLIARVIRYS
jgi:hypothetical protein